MKAIGMMTAGCVLTGLLVARLVAPDVGSEVLLGMLMPLVVAAASSVLAERTYRRDPRLLTPFMTKAFVGKMMVFGVYVVAVVTLLDMAPRPFIISFTVYFIALHLFEALYLRRMFRTTG